MTWALSRVPEKNKLNPYNIFTLSFLNKKENLISTFLVKGGKR